MENAYEMEQLRRSKAVKKVEEFLGLTVPFNHNDGGFVEKLFCCFVSRLVTSREHGAQEGKAMYFAVLSGTINPGSEDAP